MNNRCPKCRAIVNPNWDHCICCDAPLNAGTGASFQGHVDAALAELNRLGVRMMDHPDSTRQQAFVLESQITQQAKSGDLARAKETLQAWERCWIPEAVK